MKVERNIHNKGNASAEGDFVQSVVEGMPHVTSKEVEDVGLPKIVVSKKGEDVPPLEKKKPVRIVDVAFDKVVTCNLTTMMSSKGAAGKTTSHSFAPCNLGSGAKNCRGRCREGRE